MSTAPTPHGLSYSPYSPLTFVTTGIPQLDPLFCSGIQSRSLYFISYNNDQNFKRDALSFVKCFLSVGCSLNHLVIPITTLSLKAPSVIQYKISHTQRPSDSIFSFNLNKIQRSPQNFHHLVYHPHQPNIRRFISNISTIIRQKFVSKPRINCVRISYEFLQGPSEVILNQCQLLSILYQMLSSSLKIPFIICVYSATQLFESPLFSILRKLPHANITLSSFKIHCSQHPAFSSYSGVAQISTNILDSRNSILIQSNSPFFLYKLRDKKISFDPMFIPPDYSQLETSNKKPSVQDW